MESFETFGVVLTRLMRSRGCSMKELAARMEIKSANTIARIATDKSGINKVCSFCDELLSKNPLGLMEVEKETLLEAVTVNKVGVEAYIASQHMLDFVRELPQGSGCICKQAFGDDCLFIVTLDDLLRSYQDYARVDIILQNCTISGVTRAIKSFLEHRGSVEVSIEHYISTSTNQTKMIADFTSLLDVMGHPNYQFFFSPHCWGSHADTFEAYDSIFVALKCDKQGNKWTDVVSFHAEDSFDLLHNTAGEATYQFNLRQFHALRSQHNPAKATYSSDFSLAGMIEYNSRLLEMDNRYPTLVIQPDVALCMVPPDIIENVAKLVRVGNPEASQEALQQYVRVAQRRYQLFIKPERPRQFLFSKAGMLTFYQYGKSRANVFGLRDLTMEERRRIIMGMLEAAHSEHIAFHLLRNELHYNNVSYFLCGESTLFIDNYQSFCNFDSARCYNSCCVQSPEITKAFADFVEHDLLAHYVLSHEETTAFLEELLMQ